MLCKNGSKQKIKDQKDSRTVTLSDDSLNFIREYVLKPLNISFAIDKKYLDAIFDLSACFDEYSRIVTYRPEVSYDEKAVRDSHVVYCELNKIKQKGFSVDFNDINTRLQLQIKKEGGTIDRKYLKLLAVIAENLDFENEIYWRMNYDKRLAELSINLDETIDYLNTCSQQELDIYSETLEDLSEHFKSKKLIDCVKRNITRFPDEELQKQLKAELEYMKFYV